MNTLYMIYDEKSALCRWVKTWASGQSVLLELVFLRAGSTEAKAVAPGMGNDGAVEELVAVGDDGTVYRGPSAWVMAFYALEEFREWSSRLASPTLLPLARRAFIVLSKQRVDVMDWLSLSDREAAEAFGGVEEVASGLQKIHQWNAGRGSVEPGSGALSPAALHRIE